MKFFTYASAFLFVSTRQQAGECGEGRVVNKMQFCIRPRYIEGCQSYESEERCSLCEAGYQLNKRGRCEALEFEQRQEKIVGCLIRSPEEPWECKNCADGYMRSQGRCLVGVKNCQKYEKNECARCEPNYSLILNECRYNILLGCKSVAGTHSCLQCWPPFELKGETCTVQNCKTLNDYGCVTCECGYYLHADRTCRKFQQGCIRYHRGRCINCLSHYKLKGGICQIEGCLRYQNQLCIECKTQYIGQNGECIFRNCADWSNDQCLSCQQGFRNEGGVCREQKPQKCIG